MLPLLIFLVMGIFDVSNMMRISLGMQHAVRLGGVTAAAGRGVEDDTRSTTLVEDAVKGYLDLLALEDGQEPVVTVRSWEGTDTSGEGVAGDLGGPCDMVEVKVDYTYHPLEPFVAVATLFRGSGETWTIPLSRSERRVQRTLGLLQLTRTFRPEARPTVRRSFSSCLTRPAIPAVAEHLVHLPDLFMARLRMRPEFHISLMP